MGPEPCAGEGGHLNLLRQLRLGDTFGGPHNNSPLCRGDGDRAEQGWLVGSGRRGHRRAQKGAQRWQWELRWPWGRGLNSAHLKRQWLRHMVATMAKKMPRRDDVTVLNFRARKGLEGQSTAYPEDGETAQQRKGLVLGHVPSQRQSRPRSSLQLHLRGLATSGLAPSHLPPGPDECAGLGPRGAVLPPRTRLLQADMAP